MEIIKDITDQIVVIRLKGKILSGADANQIHQMVNEEIEEKRKEFILDMSEVSLINSSGVGVLIAALTAARNQGGTVRLASVSEKVRHILKMMRLDSVFEIHDSVESAQRDF